MNKYMKANIVFSKFSRDYMEIKKGLPVRPSEMGVLNVICFRDGDFTPLMLAEMIGVSKPMITAHIQALLRKGYIAKETSETDKRSFFVRPTEKGKTLAKEFEIKQTEFLKAVEKTIGESDFDELVFLLGKMQSVIEGNVGGINNAE